MDDKEYSGLLERNKHDRMANVITMSTEMLRIS